MRDCEHCFFYDDYTLTCCCHKECDDPSLDISECDDLIDAAEAAFDDYLAECTADYSELAVFERRRGVNNGKVER